MDTNYYRKNRRKYSLKAHIVLVTILISYDTTDSIFEIVKRIKILTCTVLLDVI